MRHEQSGVTLSYSISSWRVRCFSCLSTGLFVYLSIGPFVNRIYQILSICICLLSRAISADCNIHVSSCFFLFLHWFSPSLFVSMFICLVHYTLYRLCSPSIHLPSCDKNFHTSGCKTCVYVSSWKRSIAICVCWSPRGSCPAVRFWLPGDLYVGCRGHQVC